MFYDNIIKVLVDLRYFALICHYKYLIKNFDVWGGRFRYIQIEYTIPKDYLKV